MIWQKSFIMERHRFDGSDVIHLLSACGETLHCDRLVSRFGSYWPVLLVHLILWQFTYPTHRAASLQRVMAGLLTRVAERPDLPGEAWVDGIPICRGPLLSLLDYLPAVQTGGYRDARLPPTGRMTAADIAHWTATFEW
jgi:hypothetical protein